MTAVRRLLVLLAAALCGLVPAVAQGGDAGDRMAFRIHDDRVVESSGLAVSRTHPGLAYTVNDSGDDARVLVLSLRDGSVVGETSLAGVEHDDFEAVSPAPGGRLVVGDIGDNDAERDSVELYVLDEPGPGGSEVRPRTVTLTYPGGPRDAEAVVVRGSTVFVVSKEVLGGVYAAPVLASARDAFVLRRVAAAPSIITDATLLTDDEVVMRDYDRAHLVTLPGWRVVTTYRLPRTEQGESVAAAPRGRRVFAGTEGTHSPVHLVPVPTVAEVTRSGDRTPPGGQPAAQQQPEREQEQDRPRVRPTGYIVAVAAAMVAGFLIRRRRRRKRRRPPINIR